MAVLPPISVLRLASAVAPPTAALKVPVPLVLSTKAFAPSTAPVKLTSPLPVLTVKPLFSVVVPAMATALLLVLSVASIVPMVTLSP